MCWALSVCSIRGNAIKASFFLLLFISSIHGPVKIKRNSNKTLSKWNFRTKTEQKKENRKKESCVIDNALLARVERILTAFSLRKCNKCERVCVMSVMRMMRV